MTPKYFKYIIMAILVVFSHPVKAGSLYLPLQLSPEIEARIERLFVLANMPIIKRPIPVKRVHLALSRVDKIDHHLVNSIRRYIERYDQAIGVTHLSLSAATGDSEHDVTLPNQRGYGIDSTYYASFSGFWAANNWLAFNLAGIVGDRADGLKDEFPDGSFVSLGWEAMQIDIGSRPHWLSPFRESSMLMSTNAPSMAGVTISNVEPFEFFGISYEIFMLQMSKSDLILSQDSLDPNDWRSGNPRLFGLHLSFAPIEGMAIGFNRLMQHGGANRKDGFGDVANAFFHVKGSDNKGPDGVDFGNQLSSINTSYTFVGDFPVSIYMEYAGEDTSNTSDFHLGNSALMFGVHMPKLSNTLDFTYEFSEWQNAWYINSNYGEGLTNFGSIVGHWGASRREFLDAVGATSHVATLIWDIQGGKSLTSTFRKVDNEDYSALSYESAQELSIEYAQALGSFIAGGSVIAGNDVFGESYTHLSAFIRW